MWKQGNMEIGKYRNMKTGRQGYRDIWKYGCIEIQKYENIEIL